MPLAEIDARDIAEDLSKTIDHYHDLYIAEEILEKRCEAWNCLQENARKYLCLVPQNQKFKFNETERVLYQSANSRGDFDPREACYAFKSLAKYAHNLLKQPWRQEFHTIKLTSGFYVHNVATHLKNSQEILIAMGYVNISDRALKLVPNYDFATVKAVSRDCLLACQECLILSHIWEKVSCQEPNYTFTTDQVYDFRNKIKGDVEKTCQIILEEIRNKVIKKCEQESVKKSPMMENSSASPEYYNTPKGNGMQSLKMEGDEHFYDAVSPGNVSSLLFSPTTRRSKSMTFSTSTPKKMSCSKTISDSEKFFSAEFALDEDMLDGSLKGSPEIGHVYANVPTQSQREKNSTKREKTKWHTPMKYKLQPQGHLKFSKLNEREISYLMKENEADDLKMGIKKNSQHKGEKKLESYDITTFPRVRESAKSVQKVSTVPKYANDINESPKNVASVNDSSKSQKIFAGNNEPQSVVPHEPIKSSTSDSSYLDVDYNHKKYGSELSSTDVSSWDLKLKQEEGVKRNDSGDHYYDLPCTDVDDGTTEEEPKKPFRKEPCSSSFGLCQSDTVYYDPEESIGFGFGIKSPYSLSPNPKYNRADNTTFLTCDDSFKCLVDEDSNVKKGPKLDDLEDVWFHTLLKKEGEFNYLDSQPDEPMSAFESFPAKIQSGTSRSKSKYCSRYFPTSTEDSPYDSSDVFDGRLEKLSEMDYNKTSRPARGKFDDSIINANLHRQVSKITQTSKGTINSVDLNATPGDRRRLEISSIDNFTRFDPWDCKHCTYINSQNEFICEICSKSKDYVEEHDVIEGVESLLPKLYSLPEYIKGENTLNEDMSNVPKSPKKACPCCTLHNFASARICDACGFRLKEFNSPTKTTWLEDMARTHE